MTQSGAVPPGTKRSGNTDRLAKRLLGPWSQTLEACQTIFQQRNDGDRCRHCGTMDDRIHGIECPVMRAHDVLLLGLWTLRLESLLAESIATKGNPSGHDHEMHVRHQLDRIRKWRLDFHFTDPVSKL